MKKIIFSSITILTLFSAIISAKSKNYNGEEPQNLKRPPLLRMTDNGYRLIWNNNKKSSQNVSFGKIDGKKTVLKAESGKVNSKKSGFYIDLKNMESGQKYQAKIKGYKPIDFFAPKSTDSELKFAIISDHQTYEKLTIKGFSTIASLNPDFIISCGDMLEDGKIKNWATNFFANIPILEGIPFAATEGNNDCGRNLFENYLALENRWYSCTYGMARFIILDSNLAMNENSEQYAWLEKTLKSNESLWTFVIYHHSSFISTGLAWENKKTMSIRKLFEKYKVDAVFNGHHHFYDRTTPINGITYITFPSMSGGMSKTEVNKDSGFYANHIQGFNGYAEANLTAEKLSIKIKNLDGKIFDEFEIKK